MAPLGGIIRVMRIWYLKSWRAGGYICLCLLYRVAELWKDVRGKDGHNVVENISGRNG